MTPIDLNELQFDDRGHLVVDSLEELTRAELRGWIVTRLGGHDPWCPLHVAAGEGPGDLFVWAFKRCSGMSRFGMWFRQIMVELLDELLIAGRAGRVPVWAEAFLSLLGQVKINECWPQLDEVLRSRTYDQPVWHKAKLNRALLEAVASTVWRATDEWRKLICDAEYGDIALLVLGQFLSGTVACLPDYLAVVPDELRPIHLEIILTALLEKYGLGAVRDCLGCGLRGKPCLDSVMACLDAIRKEVADDTH